VTMSPVSIESVILIALMKLCRSCLLERGHIYCCCGTRKALSGRVSGRKEFDRKAILIRYRGCRQYTKWLLL
jgi:hypothetical protein